MERQLAARYAEALLYTALERNEIDQVEQDLNAALDLIRDMPDLSKLLEHPEIALEKKYQVLEKAFAAHVAKTTFSFFRLLARRRRMDLLALVAEEYSTMADEIRGIDKIEITSAVPLDADQQVRLRSVLERLVGKTLEIESTTDPAILAGVKLKIGDYIIDGSALGRLTSLDAKLKEVGAAE